MTQYLLTVPGTTVFQLLVVLGPAMLLATAMHFVAHAVQRTARITMGNQVYLSVFGWLGVSLHELGHALFCPLFGHRIQEVRLFKPDPATGTLGYVKHSYSRRNLYHRIGNFFISIGPIILGSVLIMVAAGLLLPPESFDALRRLQVTATDFADLPAILALFGRMLAASFDLLFALLQPENFLDWRYYLFLYLAFAIGSAVTLSPADLRGAGDGFAVLLGALLLLNLLTLWLGDGLTSIAIGLAQYTGVFTAVMLFALLLNLLALALLSIIARLRPRRRRRVPVR